MTEETKGKIPFLVEVDSKGKGKGIGETLVDVIKLKQSLRDASSKLTEAFEGLLQVGAFELQEVTLGMEIGAEGGVRFIGTATVSGNASITLKFAPSKG